MSIQEGLNTDSVVDQLRADSTADSDLLAPAGFGFSREIYGSDIVSLAAPGPNVIYLPTTDLGAYQNALARYGSEHDDYLQVYGFDPSRDKIVFYASVYGQSIFWSVVGEGALAQDLNGDGIVDTVTGRISYGASNQVEHIDKRFVFYSVAPAALGLIPSDINNSVYRFPSSDPLKQLPFQPLADGDASLQALRGIYAGSASAAQPATASDPNVVQLNWGSNGYWTRNKKLSVSNSSWLTVGSGRRQKYLIDNSVQEIFDFDPSSQSLSLSGGSWSSLTLLAAWDGTLFYSGKNVVAYFSGLSPSSFDSVAKL
jgi:hypothetical protein